MAKTYTKTAKTVGLKTETVTPQSRAIKGREKDMAPNNAGGFTFTITPWAMLDRFLVLGSEGGTYYVGETKLTEQNAQNVIACIKEDGVRVVNKIVEISSSGRAPKNEPALFALALVLTYGNEDAKRYAAANIREVARIGTHILHLAEYVHTMRGWGRVIRNAFNSWYTEQGSKSLAMNLVKYANRDGWTHRDILRLSHPSSIDEAHKQLLAYAAKKPYDFTNTEVEKFMNAVESAKRETDLKKLVNLITDNRLPREVIPTEALNHSEVWEALLPHMGTIAMIRNLATMTRVGLLTSIGANTKLVLQKMRNEEELKKAKFHPISALAALLTYKAGRGTRGSHIWSPINSIVDELDELFYRAFGYVEPTGKNLLFGIDVSGSMGMGDVAGVSGLTPRMASAALAMVSMRNEDSFVAMGFSTGFIKLNISAKDRLDVVLRKISSLPFDGTDCSLPMVYALQNKLPVEGFVVLTDNETWAGKIQPAQALVKFRNKMGIPAKLVVVAMTPTQFTIADPRDSGMLDVSGMDTATPNLISDFIRG